MSKGIIDTIIGGVEIVAGVVLEVISGGLNPVGYMLIAAGVGMLLTGIGTLLSGNNLGVVTASRNPIKPWDIVFGRARIGGTVIYLNEFGASNKWLDMVIVLAAHECLSVDYLFFDSQRVSIGDNNTSFTPLQQTANITSIARVDNVVTVHIDTDIPSLLDGDDVFIQNVGGPDQSVNGRFPVTIITHSPTLIFTYLSGGQPMSQGLGGQAVTAWADYSNTVYMEAMLGNQALGETFNGMIFGTPNGGDPTDLVNPPNGNPWTANCSCQGKTLVLLRLQYDSKFYASGIPQISFLLHGKKDIYDPRTDTTSYTENAALCIADYLAQKTWGFRAVMGTEIPYPQLIAAANICDEQVQLAAAGAGTESRYTCNGTFTLNLKRGTILQNMLTSCGGRLTFTGGQFIIYPAAYAGVSATLTDAFIRSNAAGGFRWRPTVSIRDLYNGVKGTYVSPSNKWTPADFPGYAQDGDHGFNDGPAEYNFDENVAADGGDRRWKDVQLPFTISAATAQRLAKIELLRNRNMGTGTFPLNMAGYQFVPMDVIAASLDYFGWDGKLLEVLACRLKLDNQQSGDAAVPLLGTEIDVQETSPDIYEWSLPDELSAAGYVQSNLPNNRTPAPPTNFKATPNQGIIVLTWTPPNDAYVTNGGHLELRYQLVVSPPGIFVSLGSADPSTTQLNVIGLIPLDTYLFEIRSVNAAGVPSAWVDATAVFPEPSAQVWMPNTLLPSVNPDPIIAEPGDLSFLMDQLGSTSAATVAVTGNLPVNSPLYTVPPVIGSVQVNGTGGSLLAGRTYYVTIAVALAGSPSVPAIVEEIKIPGGTDTQQIVLNNVMFPPGAWDQFIVYVSIDRQEMMCAQFTGVIASPPEAITINGPLLKATYSPADTSIDHLRIKIKSLRHLGVVTGLVTEVGAAVGTGPLASGWARCMHLSADRTQDTNPTEGGINWAANLNLALLATDDWGAPVNGQQRVLSMLTQKIDGSAPILNFAIVAYDSNDGKFFLSPDPAGFEITPGDVFVVRFIPQWASTQLPALEALGIGQNWNVDQWLYEWGVLLGAPVSGQFTEDIIQALGLSDSTRGTIITFAQIADVLGTTSFTDPGMVNGQYGSGIGDVGTLALQGRILAGSGARQISKVASNTNIGYSFVAPFANVDQTSLIVIEFEPWLGSTDGAQLKIASYGEQGDLNVPVPGLLERGYLVQVCCVDVDGSESPDALNPSREFFGFNDVSFGVGGQLQEVARLEFGRGSDGGPAPVAPGDMTALIEIDDTTQLQAYSILNQGKPTGASTFDLVRKPAGSDPDTPYVSLLGGNLITIPDGVHDTVILSAQFAADVILQLTKGDIIYSLCVTIGSVAPLSPVLRVYAGLPLPVTIDGTQSSS